MFFADILKIFLLSVFSLSVMFALTKLMGSKQLSQMTMFDYIIGITIGSVAAEMSTSLEADFAEPLTAMIIYGLAAFIISYMTCKSRKMRIFITGRSRILYHSGRLYRKNLLKSRLDINEFLMLCRNNGYFDLCDIYAAILEPNGKLSIIPTADARPVQGSDLNLAPKQQKMLANVIVDGIVQTDVLGGIGRNSKWLLGELRRQGFAKPSDIALAVCDDEGNVSVYRKINNEKKLDLYD